MTPATTRHDPAAGGRRAANLALTLVIVLDLAAALAVALTTIP